MQQKALLSAVLLVCVLGIDPCSAEDYKDAIFVALSHDLSPSQNPVIFDEEKIDIRGTYDKAAGKFYAFKAGVYWTSLSAGVRPSASSTHACLHDGSTSMGCVFRGSKYHNGADIMNREMIVSVSSLQSMHMYSSQSYGLYSDGGLQSSLTLFRLSDLMSSESAIFFSAVRTSGISLSAGDILSFNKLVVNEGHAFSLQDSTFTAPQDGVYMFSVNAGAYTNSGRKISLVIKKNVIDISTLERLSTAHTSHDSINRVFLCRLIKGDKVYIASSITSYLYSDSHFYTSLSGFLYDPVHKNKIAWSVARKSSWSDKYFLSPIPFDDVIVNEGNHWMKEKHGFTAPFTGIYYVTLTVGASSGKPVYVAVMAGTEMKFVLNRQSTVHNGLDMLTRSGVVFIEAGNWVFLAALPNTTIYSNSRKITTFSGIFLYPAVAPK